MATKFNKMLTADEAGIKGKRAELLEKRAEAAQKKIVQEIEDRKTDLETKLVSLNDLYPDSTLSLQVAKPDFDPASTFAEIQTLKLQLLEVEVELETAKETYDEWFKEEVGE